MCIKYCRDHGDAAAAAAWADIICSGTGTAREVALILQDTDEIEYLILDHWSRFSRDQHAEIREVVGEALIEELIRGR